MSEDYYTASGDPATKSSLASVVLRAEYAAIAAGFAKIVGYTGNGGKIVAINAGGTAQVAVATTGTGSVVLATSPSLVTPALGTPSSGVATNLTGTAAGLTAGNVTTNANLTGVVTSVGNATAIADTALSIAKTSGLQTALDAKQPLDAALTVLAAGSDFVQFTGPLTTTKVFTLPDASSTLLYSGGALGTPASGVATNLTGTAASLTAGNVTTNANLTGHVTSVGNAAVLGSFTLAQLNTAISDADVQPLDAALTALAAGSDFVQFTGPLTTTKVFTLPDASSTLLVSGGALGTPSSGVATNLTGTAAGLTAGNVTTNANLTGGVTSVGNAATVVTNANLTGPVTSVGNATSVAAAQPSITSVGTLSGLTVTAPIAGSVTGSSGSTTGNAATVTTNANLTGPITSVGNVTSVASQSGTSSTFVMSNSPILFTTGDVKLTIKTAADTGWVMCNDGTIGNAASGGSTRANADTVDLFTLLWNNVADAQAAVSTGRGASAAADYAANKTIALTKMLGRAFGASGAGSGLTSRVLGLAMGEETHILITAEMPAHTHIVYASGTQSAGDLYQNGATDQSSNKTTSSTGGDGAHNNMQPTAFVNAMIKL